VHAYDLTTGAWTACAPLGAARTGASVVAVGGKIVVAGGWSGAGHLRSAEVYDPSADAWTVAASMERTRAWASASCVGGKVVVAGGVSVREAEEGENAPAEEEEEEEEAEPALAAPTGDGEATTAVAATAEVVEEEEEAEEEEGDEFPAAAAPVTSGNISIVEASVEVYDLATNSWTCSPADELLHACSSAASVVDDDGALFVLGGKVEGGPSCAATRFDRAAGAWTAVADLPMAVESATAVRLGPNRVALVGGKRAQDAKDADRDLLATIEGSDVTWAPAPWGRAVGMGENGACAAVWV